MRDCLRDGSRNLCAYTYDRKTDTNGKIMIITSGKQHTAITVYTISTGLLPFQKELFLGSEVYGICLFPSKMSKMTRLVRCVLQADLPASITAVITHLYSSEVELPGYKWLVSRVRTQFQAP